MADGYWSRLPSEWYDDDSCVAFEPAKVLRRLGVAFPTVEVNPAGAQRGRLEFELVWWTHHLTDPERRAAMVRASCDLYARTGPMYTFVVSLGTGVRIAGSASRRAVTFKVPADVAAAEAEPLVVFLRSLGIGDLKRHKPMRVDVPATAAHRVYPPVDSAPPGK